MFTGIVEELGEVAQLVHRVGAWRLGVKAQRVLEGTEVGSSLALNGVCLTVVERTGTLLAFDVGPDTLKATALADLAPGAPVNLERPLRLGAPLGGHLVLGHVDGVGRVARVAPERDTVRMRIEVPDPDLERYLIPKGSVAVDGVSLTVAGLEAGAFEVMVIPHTLAVTTLGKRAAGDRVNLEMDVIGKYLYRFVARGDP
ncbi:MAG: riboflavin synthase [Candidatus Rokubacteria bacterium]|nr:riboflavin synthase [Candidatus Rokubacteria bacterium]MBI2543927.1 riboflavin synthase [Candidatus Rokubacteria bacterium]MBI2555250.1 riboflavin synthase [Candidatus Rokubacteria bacterium]